MQIKSYILVRVTEASNFVSGLHEQMGLLSVWLVRPLRSRGKPSSHLRTDLLGIAVAQAAEDGRSHPASLRRTGGSEGPRVPPGWLGGGEQQPQQERAFWHSQTSPHKHTAVVSSGADHVLVVVREADVRHMSRVAKVTLVFGKFFGAGEIKELH